MFCRFKHDALIIISKQTVSENVVPLQYFHFPVSLSVCIPNIFIFNCSIAENYINMHFSNKESFFE